MENRPIFVGIIYKKRVLVFITLLLKLFYFFWKEDLQVVEFNSNPNQRKIKVNKEKTDDKAIANRYARINLIALKNAMSTLTPKAFELWIYFSKNADEHCFYLSKVDFLNWANVKATSYYSAFNELEEKGYLVAIDNEKADPTNYNFYEIPKKEKAKENELNIISMNNDWTFRIEEEIEENKVEDVIEKQKRLFNF